MLSLAGLGWSNSISIILVDIVVINLAGIILTALVTDIMLSVDNVLVDLGFIKLVIFMALSEVELTSPEF